MSHLLPGILKSSVGISNLDLLRNNFVLVREIRKQCSNVTTHPCNQIMIHEELGTKLGKFKLTLQFELELSTTKAFCCL